MCVVDIKAIEEALGVKVEKGPKDLKDIPEFFGYKKKKIGYGEYKLKILAEINDAPLLNTEQILNMAHYYKKSGADIIDVGCTPDIEFPQLGEVITLLKQEGFMVSVDTFNKKEILAANKAGVDYLLSINSQDMEVASELRCIPVVIPDFGAGLESLDNNIEELEKRGIKNYIIDPILNPINFGLAESLYRYYRTRQEYPSAEILMGLGNVTELTDADSTGIHALCAGFMNELNINYVLTTEVANWAKGSVKELDKARRLMYYTSKNNRLPKDMDDSLLTIKDRKTDYPTEAELLEMQKLIKDRNFRIFIDEQFIYVFNATTFIKDTDIQKIFSQLDIRNDPSHAFYLGQELMKAKIALKLHKKFLQEEELRWGYLNEDEV
jgi:dihydropteroate synthase-like protein